MFLLRTSARQQLARFLTPVSTRAVPATFITRRFASGDYGSGEHNNLKRSKSEQEHPGPPPPDTSNKGSNKSSSSSNGAQPKIHNASHPKEGEESPEVAKHNEEMKGRQEGNGSGSQKTGNGAQPKILSESPPKEGEEPADVAKHNEEMKGRAERANEGAKNSDAEKDKVSKGFWKGTGGRDGEP